jgi:hypothetical protein
MDEWGWEHCARGSPYGPSSRSARSLHSRRLHPRATVVGRRRPHRVAPDCGARGRATSVRAAPAAPRARPRARPRGRAAEHHSAPAHANPGTTSICLQGIDPEEIIVAVRTRRAPDDAGQRGATALNDHIGSGSASALLLRRTEPGVHAPRRHARIRAGSDSEAPSAGDAWYWSRGAVGRRLADRRRGPTLFRSSVGSDLVDIRTTMDTYGDLFQSAELELADLFVPV